MSLARSAVRGALWTLLENTGTQLASFVLFLVFARLIEPKAIGLVQVAVTFYSFLTIFVEHGFTTTIIRSKTVEPSLLNTAFWSSVTGGVVIAVALTIAAPGIAAIYRIPELPPVLRTLAWCLPILTMSVIQSAVLIRGLQFRTQALRRLVAVFGGGVVGVVLAFRGFGPWALVARFVCETTIDCIVAWLWTPWRPALAVARKDMLELYSFASRIAGAYVIDFLNRRIDDIVVGLVLGPIVLGYFAVASRGVTLVTEVAIRAAQRTALPIFSRLQDDRPRLRAAYYEAIELASCLAIPLFVGMASVASELCLTLFGQKWAPVIPAMRILGFSGVAIAISAFTPPLLVAIGKPQALFYLSVVEAVLGVTCSVVAAHWGLTAVAIGYVARSYLLVPAALVLVGKTMDVRPTDVAKLVVRPAGAALLMALAVGFVRGMCGGCSAPVRLVVLAAVGAGIYVGTMLLIARPTVERLLARVQARRAVGGPASAMATAAEAPAKAASS